MKRPLLLFAGILTVVVGLLVWMPAPFRVPPMEVSVPEAPKALDLPPREFTLPELVEHCEAIAGQIWLLEGDYYAPRAAVSEDRTCFIQRYGDDGFAKEWVEVPWPEKP